MSLSDTSGALVASRLSPLKVHAPVALAAPTTNCAVKLGYCASITPALLKSKPNARSRSTEALPENDAVTPGVSPLPRSLREIVCVPPVKPAVNVRSIWVGNAFMPGLSGSGDPGVGCVATTARKPSCAVSCAPGESSALSVTVRSSPVPGVMM